MMPRELATVLAALRFWQANMEDDEREESTIATDSGLLTPLTDNEIDTLCEALNS